MTARNLIALSVRSLAGRRAASVAPLLSVGLATGTTFLLLSVAAGVRQAGVGGLLASLPITRLIVTARQVDIFFLRFGAPGSSLEAAAAESLRGIDGVTAVLPEQVLTMPTSLAGDLIGTSFSTDCAVYGVSAGFFPRPPPGFGPAPPGDPVPVVLSSQLIDLYNSGFAGSQNLPGLSEKALIGRHFTLFIGTSSFQPAARYEKTKAVRCRIVGVSDMVSVTGVTVPEVTAREWHEWYHGADVPPRYASIHVEVASSDLVDGVRRQIEARGLQVRNPRELAEKVALASQYLSVVIAAIIVVFLLLAGIGTATTLGLEVALQAERIGLYRSMGAAAGDIRLIYLVRAILIGAIGAVSGLAGGVLLLAVTARGLSAVLPFMARLPASWLAPHGSIAAAALALGMLASVGAGLIPAHRAARMDPVDALRSAET